MILETAKKYIDAFLDLIYPNLCVSCQNALLGNETALCTACRTFLPRTDSHLMFRDNLLHRFRGKVEVNGVFAFLKFERGGKVQDILHSLKYENRPDIGITLGQLYGSELYAAGYQYFDLILPIPLHPQKQLQRGYNQSAAIAQGLAEGLNIGYSTNNLIRTKFTETQTKKSRLERFENVSDIFAINEPEKIKGKSIVLVDDVITTGATLEAAIPLLWQAQAAEVWIVAIAMA